WRDDAPANRGGASGAQGDPPAMAIQVQDDEMHEPIIPASQLSSGLPNSAASTATIWMKQSMRILNGD
ncbi:unnamed protein product, partial [Urochloa humidicola]